MDVNAEGPKPKQGKEYRNVNYECPHIKHEFFVINLELIDLFGLINDLIDDDFA
jgi:hypothetical protein